MEAWEGGGRFVEVSRVAGSAIELSVPDGAEHCSARRGRCKTNLH
jgi:hypothetical protein